MWILSGNTTETGDTGKSPGKSSLFFLTLSPNLGIGLPGDKVGWAAEQHLSVLSGALLTVLEIPVD